MSDYEALRGRHTAQFEAMLPEHIARLDWSADALQAERQRALRALLTAAKARSSWHGKRLAHVDVERITAEDLSSIPPMNKHDLMSNFDGVLTDAVFRVRLSKRTWNSWMEIPICWTSTTQWPRAVPAVHAESLSTTGTGG